MSPCDGDSAKDQKPGKMVRPRHGGVVLPCSNLNAGQDLPSHVVDLLRSEFGKHWQRQEFVGATFRDRERTARVSERTVSFLQVDWHRIVDATGNTAGG